MPLNRLKQNKTALYLLILVTLPVSLPYFVIKAVRRKMRKARIQQEIRAMDGVPATSMSGGSGEHPLLSVIMPVYNIQAYLEASIVSVLNQTYSNIELLIVNDASTDNSLSVARMFEAIDKRVRVIDLPFNTPGGAGVPSNIGMEHATGEFVGFVDGDDFLNSYALEKLMRAAVEHDSDLTVGSFKTFLDDTKEISEPYDFSTFSQMPSNVALAPADHPAGMQISAVPWRKIYKRSFLEKSNVRFPEGDLFFEDNPFHWDAMTASKSVVFVPATVSYHRMNREGQTMSSSTPKLAAYFSHFAAISRSIKKNSADFAWPPFLKFVERTEWIVNRQLEPVLKDQFKLRFLQTIEEQIEPYLPAASKRALDSAKARFKTETSPADLSVLHYHDPAHASDDDLIQSIQSMREKHNANVEVVLLHNGPPPKLTPECGEALLMPANANLYRSFNQGLQLCSGGFIAFTVSGDRMNPAAVEAALKLDTAPSDIVLNGASSTMSALQSPIAFYRRRLVQDNGVFFGPTKFGWFSFDQTCGLYAETDRAVSQELISRRPQSKDETDISSFSTEVGIVRRKLATGDFGDNKVSTLRGSFEAFFEEAEQFPKSENLTELKSLRAQVSTQFRSTS